MIIQKGKGLLLIVATEVLGSSTARLHNAAKLLRQGPFFIYIIYTLLLINASQTIIKYPLYLLEDACRH